MVKNIGQKTFISSLVVIASQWISRLLGIVSIVIISRILTPDDYGVIAIATLSITLLQIILVDGSEAYLLRKSEIKNDDLDTAWSIRLVLLIVISSALILTKEKIAIFFNDDRLIDIIFYMSLGSLFSSLSNIGYILDKAKFEYRYIFKCQITIKLIGFFSTVTAAIYIGNYWALVLGMIAMQFSEVPLSYYLFKYRPRFTFCKIKEQWNFTKWMLLSNITSFIRNKMDQILISKYLESSNLGFYNMTYQLSSMPYTEIVEPIHKVVYTSYASALDNKEKLANIFIQVVGVIAIIIFPIYLGLLSLSENIVSLLLGSNWNYINDLFPFIISLLLAQTLSLLATNMLTVMGKIKVLMILNWIMTIVMIIVLMYIIRYKNLELFIFCRAFLAITFLPIFYISVFKFLSIEKRVLLFSIFRPFLSSLVMFLCVNSTLNSLSELNITLSLVIEILIGTIVYILILLFLWSITGKKAGGEEYIIDKLYYVINKNKFTKKYFSHIIRRLLK